MHLSNASIVGGQGNKGSSECKVTCDVQRNVQLCQSPLPFSGVPKALNPLPERATVYTHLDCLREALKDPPNPP